MNIELEQKLVERFPFMKSCYRKKKEPHYEEPYVITDEQIKEFQEKHLKNIGIENKSEV